MFLKRIKEDEHCTAKDDVKARTVRVVGIENFSVTTSIRFDSGWFASLPCTMKYLGFLNSNADIFPGSRVSVAEKSSFWQDVVLCSVKKDGIEYDVRLSKSVGDKPSGSRESNG